MFVDTLDRRISVHPRGGKVEVTVSEKRGASSVSIILSEADWASLHETAKPEPQEVQYEAGTLIANLDPPD